MGKLTNEMLQSIKEFKQLKTKEDLEVKDSEIKALIEEITNKIEEYQVKATNAKTDTEIIEVKKEFELLIDLDKLDEIKQEMLKLKALN